jgi:hypothetical protein
VIAGLAWEQPIRVAATHQCRTEVVDVLVDDSRYRLVELELKRGSVLDVVFWEREPLVGVRSSGFD